MNEQIKELLEQAGVKYVTMPKDTVYEKFAELIVRECISTLNKSFMGDLNREDMEVRRCIEDVKKHFGVEE